MTMLTLLANPKMNPRLQARVRSSVSGRRRNALRSRASARLLSLLRVGGVIGVAAIVALGLLTRRRINSEFTAAKQELLNAWFAETRGVSVDDFAQFARVEAALSQMAGNYQGDVVVERLRSPAALAEALRAPAIYVRGPLAAFASQADIRKIANDSGRDALLSCLLDPPAERSEKALLPKARAALLGSAAQDPPIREVSRLFELESGIQFLKQEWGDRVRGARDLQELSKLSRELRHAPILRAKHALKSRLLIGVADEANEGNGPTELDGEHRHQVRLLVSDIATGDVLLRQRRVVDPAWITANRRSQYARELDGCRFALEVREQVSSPIGP
ncbi:MAG TPA: hypothetical protein VIV60_14100 [Polyangiaceae bacterium]